MRWEYDYYFWNAASINDALGELDKILNKKGEEGWELVTSNSVDFRSNDGNLEKASSIIYIFKRELDS